MDLKQEVENLKREIEELKINKFNSLSLDDIENIKNALFDRQAVTLASGATLKYEIVTIRGKRRAIPTYNKFTPLV